MYKSVPLMDASLATISQYHGVWLKMAFKIINKKDCDDEANELVQEAYLKLHDHFQKTELKSISSLYIFKVLRNTYYNQKTKKQYEYPTDDILVFEDLEDSQDTLEARKMMAEALDELPFLEREILLQHQEKSQRQLQKETGVCRDRLRLHKNRGMKKLQEIAKRKFKTA